MTNGELPLRFATERDAPSLARLINQAFRVESFFKDGDRLNIQEVQDRLRTGRFLVISSAEALIACVYVETNGERGYMGLLSVSPECQGMRLGSRLIRAAEAYCRDHGCSALDLRVVNLRTELPPLYRHFGYRETGTESFPSEVQTTQPCHFIVMSKSLT